MKTASTVKAGAPSAAPSSTPSAAASSSAASASTGAPSATAAAAAGGGLKLKVPDNAGIVVNRIVAKPEGGYVTVEGEPGDTVLVSVIPRSGKAKPKTVAVKITATGLEPAEIVLDEK